jgi:hypothetical protein
MPKEEYPKQMICEKCKECDIFFIAESGSMDGIGNEYVCSGIIIKPKDPKDVHEKFNRIRLCVCRNGLDFDAGFDIKEMTELEAADIISVLGSCLSASLNRLQPTTKQIMNFELEQLKKDVEKGVSES